MIVMLYQMQYTCSLTPRERNRETNMYVYINASERSSNRPSYYILVNYHALHTSLYEGNRAYTEQKEYTRVFTSLLRDCNIKIDIFIWANRSIATLSTDYIKKVQLDIIVIITWLY